MRRLIVLTILLSLALAGCAALEPPLFLDKDTTITPPEASIPALARRWLRVWRGTWDNGRDVGIAVREIRTTDEPGVYEVKIVYAVGRLGQWGGFAGRQAGTVTGNTLTITTSMYPTSFRLMSDGTLRGEWRVPGDALRATLIQAPGDASARE